MNQKSAPIIVLQRTKTDGDSTLGTLEIGGPVFKHYATIESTRHLFPAGIYQLRYEYSPKFKRELWELKGIPGRAEIKIHNANTADQLLGCIAPGMRHGVLNGKPAVLSSRLALSSIVDALRPWETVGLSIEVVDAGEDGD